KRLNKQWAIKEYRHDSQHRQLARDSLLKEASLIKKLDHPRLPRIVDIIEKHENIYVVMDYIEGEPLNKVLDAYGAQPQEAVVEWGKQLADVLDYLHTLTPPVVFRDMKPANIMLKPDGSIRLFDFGIAKEIEDDTEGGTTVGTRGYAAPEQFSHGMRIDARTDIYALGVTLYHLVTGKNPAEPPYELYPIRHWNPALSSGLEWLIQKCTQLNPGDRYQSCAEVIYVLENLEKFESAYKKKQRSKFNAFIASVILTVVFAIAGTGFLFAKNDEWEKTVEYLKNQHTLKSYTQLIEKDAGKDEYYLELIEIFQDEHGESKFNAADAEELKSAFSDPHWETLRDSDPSGYARVQYDLGRLYWNYYRDDSGSDQATMDAARKYFNAVLDMTDPDPDRDEGGAPGLTEAETKQAEMYYDLAFFGTPEAVRAIRGDDDTTLKDRRGDPIENPIESYWAVITDIKDTVSTNSDLPNIVRLTSLNRIAYVASAYTDLFRKGRNGFAVSDDEMAAFYDAVRDATASIDVTAGSASETLKGEAESNLGNLKTNILGNYGREVD
ncbi:MAG: serine/threonine protein kinase, partial [Clostridiales Family XIII bacterium]|nr:serine/threonine protein kinase [Clostridiales Family XIII bacterium]